MTTRTIPKSEWKSFFDGISKSRELEQKKIEIEIVSLDLGDQVIAKWLPLFGIVYETRSNTLEVGVESLTHMIHLPKSIYVEEDGVGMNSFCVTDENETQHIIHLREPLVLPR